MEFIQDYATLLPRLLPPSLANPLLTLLTTTLGLTRTLQSHLTPFLTRLITQPDIASILLLLIALFVSMKVLDMLYRAVLFWINLALRLVFWGAVVGLGVWVWSRGPEGFVQDVQGLGEYWVGEYRRYSGEVEGFRRQKEEQIRMQAARKGRGWR
ncbi:hypothetical protein T440DRAFT_438803 [Plenodomus tracheiphilus IPT5]|uniref:Nuclear pore assembly and biogenesis-domain-containing protein n=1 Tax=Plenodomus tracheiphilus IPT5 TaxID=1408161 RepID=A0A6A7BKS8_9PLEO|nr:hypothetical protein T440DRAFT_438803 [Plenodomus tracheiphilus IPT5]